MIRQPDPAAVHQLRRVTSSARGKAKRPEHQDQKEHRQKHLVTQLYKSLKVIYKSQYEAMTDYSAAIYGLIAFASVITAGVVYVLAQPTDVPVAQKTRS